MVTNRTILNLREDVMDSQTKLLRSDCPTIVSH